MIDSANLNDENHAMNVTLPATLENFVRRKIEAGVYQSESDLVSDSVRQMQMRDEEWCNEAAKKIDAGLEDVAAGRMLTAQQVKESMNEAKARWRAQRTGA